MAQALGTDSRNADVNAALMELGVEVATTQTFQTGYTDLSAQLTAIMESNPDALFVSALASQVATIMTQGREMGLTAQYIVPELSMNEVARRGRCEGQLPLRAGTACRTIRRIKPLSQDTGLNTESNPTRGRAQSYATLKILNAAITKARAAGSRTEAPDAMAIRDALAMTMDFDTILGSFSFDETGKRSMSRWC